jgi:peptidoglycan/LPS O-acetylase OafA/YrhL
VIGRIDAFAWGGLLAFYQLSGQLNLICKVNKLAWLVLVLFIGLHFLPMGTLQPLRDSVFYLLCFFIIANLIDNQKGFVGQILEYSPLIYIGKISYGIYLYHNVMQWLVPYFTSELNIPFPSQEQEYLRFIIYLTLTLIVSTISWFLIEKPLLKLKSKYN